MPRPRTAPGHPLQPEDLPAALEDATALDVQLEAMPWADVRRAWALAQGSLRYAGALSVAAAERNGCALLTADARLGRSGAPVSCDVVTVS